MVATKTRTPDWKEMRRWRALELKRDGWTQQEIADALGVSKVAVSQWMTAVHKHGSESLKARPHKGATPKLAADQLKMIPEFLSHGAEAYGFRGEVWTCRRIAQVIEREFAVSFHKDHVSRLLKALRWTPQKPMERAAQRDEEKIIEWREETWPELKKKRVVRSKRPSLLTNPAFESAARCGPHLCAVWRDPGTASLRHARSLVGDEWDYARRSTLYADSSPTLDQQREHRVFGTRAADSWTQAVGAVGWLAHSSQQRNQIFSGQWWGAVCAVGEVARLRARPEPG